MERKVNNRADWENSIVEAKVFTGLQCHLRKRKRRRKGKRKRKRRVSAP
jgi:hypothetical protein